MSKLQIQQGDLKIVQEEISAGGPGTAREIARRLRTRGLVSYTASRTNQALYRLLATGAVERDRNASVPVWSISGAASSVTSSRPAGSTAPARDTRDGILFSFQIASQTIRVVLSSDSSPNDPYYVPDWAGEYILATVNIHHPFWMSRLEVSSQRKTLAAAVAVDAYVYWRSSCMSEPPSPHETHALRDEALRHCRLIAAKAWA